MTPGGHLPSEIYTRENCVHERKAGYQKLLLNKGMLTSPEDKVRCVLLVRQRLFTHDVLEPSLSLLFTPQTNLTRVQGIKQLKVHFFGPRHGKFYKTLQKRRKSLG